MSDPTKWDPATKAVKKLVEQGLVDEFQQYNIAQVIREEYDKAEPTETQVKRAVDRFLGWRLPENFNPDCGISFKKTFNDHLPVPMKYQPIGTNLFDAGQATEMVRHMLAHD